jgi:hypothetical protein
MAKEPIEIDHRGFNNMVKELRNYSNIKTRPLMRGLASDVLHAAAGRTRVGSVKEINESLNKHFGKPHEVPGKGFVGITKNGKVWVNLVRWGNKKKWLLAGTGGKMQNVKDGQQMPNARQGVFDKETARDINELFKFARKYRRQQMAYRKSMIGLSQASWLHLIRLIKMPVRNQRGIKKDAYTLRIPSRAKAALKAFEQMSGRDNFTVVISNAVQATLNNSKVKSKTDGMNAFRLAMNGQTKRFQTEAKKDFRGYVQKFAKRHGAYLK